MIIGFSKYGRGNSGPALDYLRGYLVNGETRSVKPEVVRGDPKAVAEIIDSLPFLRKYPSGVLSFAPEDRVTPEIQQDIMNRFEDTVFAGLPPERRSITWIRHEDKSRLELHFITARVDLGSGKSLNIAPPTPASRELLDSLRESINQRYGFASPSDPARAQSVSIPNHVAKLAAQAKRLGRSAKPDIRQEIAKRVEARIAGGAVSSRADVISFLKGQGFTVVRAGANYITVVVPHTGDRVRLKGNIFSEDFSPNELPCIPSQRDPAQLLALDQRLEHLVEQRANYNRARYGIKQGPANARQRNEELAHDGTRNKTLGNCSALGEIPSGTRATACHNDFGLNQAAQRFGDAVQNIECARERLGQADRVFARDFDQAVNEAGNFNRANALVQQYGAMPLRHSHQRGMEMELEL